MSSQKSKGHPTQKIITNQSNRYFFKCNYCSKSIEGRGDKHLKHILDWNACPMAPDHACTKVRNYLATKNRNQALLLPPITDVDSAASSSSPSESTAKAPQKWKNLFGFVDLPVTPEQAPVQISNCFVAENWFFHNLLDEIQPSYQAPSLSHSIMDSEVVRVQIEDIAHLKECKKLTYLLDGWEDKIR
ncbi:hypothetical protein EV702DRAFT_1199779 [Suillus placidus]|uniref:BED-type domain-containing protein n=1 Tax=Suillus placidus TaxID=48579 RepID=A0A9P6ZRI4_9AGAM|nr:hypothetical protein EV702DRAFT_1199779 [Suillus placidus]